MSQPNVKLVKLITGESVIAEVLEQDDTKVVINKPVHFVPDRNQFVLFEGLIGTRTFAFNPVHVLGVFPISMDSVVEAYIEVVLSEAPKIEVPDKKIIVAH